MPRKLLGWFGGSFDPPHWGHFRLAQTLLQQLGFDRFFFLPAFAPWQKPPLRFTAPERVAMLQAGIEEIGGAQEIDCREIEARSDGSATATLRGIRSEFGSEAAICWILGEDQWQRLHTWREAEALSELAHLCVVQRSAAIQAKPTAEALHLHHRWREVEQPAQLRQAAAGLMRHAAFDDARSSSAMRERLFLGQSIENDCPRSVERLIAQSRVFTSN